jgi:hypothetical protein
MKRTYKLGAIILTAFVVTSRVAMLWHAVEPIVAEPPHELGPYKPLPPPQGLYVWWPKGP